MFRITVAAFVALTLSAALPAAHAQQVVHVADHGARPDTGEDTTASLRAAIAAAADTPGAVVQFEAGTYRVGDPLDQAGSVFTIAGANDLTLAGAEGRATKLVITNPRQGVFALDRCVGVTVQDFTIDYDPLPYTQGEIVAADQAAGHFDLALHEGFPTLDAPWFAQAPTPFGRWGMIFDREERRLKSGATDHVFAPEWEHVRDNIWRMFPPDDQHYRLGFMEAGDRFVHMARGGGSVCHAQESRACRFEDITIHSGPGLAVGLVRTDRIYIKGVRIELLGEERLLTTNADGVHCQQNLRGPVIEDCMFEGMADDSINIYYYPSTILEARGNDTFLIDRPFGVVPGDHLVFFAPVEGVKLGEARALEVVQEGAHGVLRIDAPIEGVVAGAPRGAVAGEGDENATTIYNQTRCGSGFIIRNNEFRMHRRYAAMIKAHTGVIENNVVDRVSGHAFVIGNEPHWPEGSVPHGILVRGNTIRNIGYSQGYGQDKRGAAIMVHTLSLHGLAKDRLVHNVVVEENTFTNPPGAAILFGAVKDCVAADNTVVYEAGYAFPRETAAVLVENAVGVQVHGLDVHGDQPKLSGALQIGAEVTSGARGIVTSAVRLNGASADAIDDQRQQQ